MNGYNKGSVLPRSLSSSDQVYLAPSLNAMPYIYTVAVRNGANVHHFQDHSLDEILDWANDQYSHQAQIRLQLDHLQGYENRTLFGGEPGPLIMGIVNVTPDSFSDGGEFYNPEAALRHAAQLKADGADILDIGGESTRPGADAVNIEDEIKRVVPVIEGCRNLASYVSIDTRKSEVMKSALSAGANIVNDVTALEFDADSPSIVAQAKTPVILMHSSADPSVMQDNPQYDHALFDVYDYLKSRIEFCMDAGISKDQIVVDPGIGFGKTLAHNLILLKGLRFFHALGCPILLGVSRKSFIGKIDGTGDAKSRLGGSLSSLLYGLSAGVQIFRVHDVAETRQAVSVWQSIDKSSLV